MPKKIIFYLFLFVLFAAGFRFFDSLHKELIHYTELTARTNKVFGSFQNFSRQISNAAIVTPELLMAGRGKQVKPMFYTDSQSVQTELALLKSLVVDTVNIRIVQHLDTLIKEELHWLLNSNVPDSILNNRSAAHLAAFRQIQELIEKGIGRTGVLLENRQSQLDRTAMKIRACMLFFILLSGVLVFYTAAISFRQQSKRKDKEAELEASNRLLRDAQHMGKIGNWEYNTASGELYWSDEVYNTWGLNKTSGQPAYEWMMSTVYPADRQQLAGELEMVFAGHKEHDLEFRIVMPAGAVKWLHGRGRMVKDKQGKPVIFQGIVKDIDARKTTEISLQENIKLLQDYRFALDQSTIIAITDQRGIILSVNDNFCTISGYSREELVGSTHKLINSGYHPAAFFKDFWDTIASGKVWQGEIRNRAKNGNFYWVYTTVVPFLDVSGKPYRYLAIRFDISEKKQAEAVVLDTLHEKNTILESIADAFFAVDSSWKVTYWNRVAEEALNRPKADMLGKNLWEVFADSVGSNSYIKYHEAVAKNQPVNFEDHYALLNKWYEISAYPSSRGLSVYFKDITERKLSQISLTKLNKHLEDQARKLLVSNTELEQFAYVASHDLQEPLRMVTGFLSQLEKKYDPVLDEKGKQYIFYAIDGARRMRQMILDLLEFSRVGRTEDDMVEFDLGELVNEMQELFHKEISSRQGIIEAGSLPVIKMYKTRISQVFRNLIGNALKYARRETPPRIHISVQDLGTHWQFVIADNGIGIEPEYHDKVFIIFQRLHSKDEYEGSGMGLAICKKIVEGLGGKIWIESTGKNGSTFYFTIAKEQGGNS